jgi:DNA modification methylase
VLLGDSRVELSQMQPDTFDFIVTSPPYWSILTKPLDHKTRTERVSKGLETKYSEHPEDLGNLVSYEGFQEQLRLVFNECYRLLAPKRYMCVIVSDFRHKSTFVPFHSHVTDIVCSAGFSLEGITVLAQDSKNLYPYGMPSAFVSNIHHQYILVFRKHIR